MVTGCRSPKRILGTYYRVLFWGPAFGKEHQREYIYKEPTVTPLASISERLKELYQRKLGSIPLELITDSKEIGDQDVKPGRAYLQITSVDPFWPATDMQRSHFDLHHEVHQFVYGTPFTKGGKAHGDVADQCLSKTILTLADGLSFPHLKKRFVREGDGGPFRCFSSRGGRVGCQVRVRTRGVPFWGCGGAGCWWKWPEARRCWSPSSAPSRRCPRKWKSSASWSRRAFRI